MADGKIYITITDEPISNDPNNIQKVITPNYESGSLKNSFGNNANDNLIEKYMDYQFFNFIKQQALQQVNFDIENIGFITGNYTQQRHIQEAYTLGSKLVGIGVSFMAGGVVGGMLAIAGSTINLVREEWKYNEQIKRQNKNITQLKYISGLDNYTNGSR